MILHQHRSGSEVTSRTARGSSRFCSWSVHAHALVACHNVYDATDRIGAIQRGALWSANHLDALYSRCIELRAPLRTSEPLARVIGCLRKDVPALGEDRLMSPDLRAAARLVGSAQLIAAAGMAAFPAAWADVAPMLVDRIEQ